MLKLSKKAEYAIMAVRYMALTKSCVTAKEVASAYAIPYELLTKILQQLVKFNIIRSYQGVKGGYSLTKDPDEINLKDVINAIDPGYRIIECMKTNRDKFEECSLTEYCTVKGPLIKLQNEIDKLFEKTTIMQII